MNIVLVSDALLTGGAETFVLRLASALQARGDSVSVFVLRPDLIDRALANQLAPGVPLKTPSLPALSWVLRVDGLLFRLGVGFSLLRWFQVRGLRSHLAKHGTEIAHSHLFPADIVTARACSAAGVSWVTTMHGDYISLESRGESRAARIPDFQRALREVESSARRLVAITEYQRNQLQRLLRGPARDRTSKIYNGYAAPLSPLAPPDKLQQIPPGEFVIGMVSRGIQEKGWDALLAAFTRLHLPSSWLVLVGDGDYLRSLRDETQDPRILFIGNVLDPLRYVARFDVACLPTRCPTESLPTVVIEYLVAGKPVIATHIGEIPRMLEATTPEAAGVLIPQGSVEAMTDCLVQALSGLYTNATERSRLQANARKAAAKFDMQACVDQYVDIYTEATL